MDISDTFLAELRLNSEFNSILAQGELSAPLLLCFLIFVLFHHLTFLIKTESQ